MVRCAARVVCSPLRQHCDPFSVLAHTLRTFRGAKSRRGRADQLAKRLLPPVRVDPCPPCLVLCVGGVGFRVLAHRAHLGRFGGSRWGWVLEIKFPCRRTGTRWHGVFYGALKLWLRGERERMLARGGVFGREGGGEERSAIHFWREHGSMTCV